MECVAKRNNCPCSCLGCEKHGNCCQCVAYHRERNQIPGCFFSPAGEKALDRSLDAFIKDRAS